MATSVELNNNRKREVISGRVTLGFDPICNEIGHDIDVTFPELGIGFCKRCPGMQINLRKYQAKQDIKTRQKYGCAEGDIIEAVANNPSNGYFVGQKFRVIAIDENDVFVKVLDENGNDKIGDGSEARILFCDFKLSKTRVEVWNEENPDKVVEVDYDC